MKQRRNLKVKHIVMANTYWLLCLAILLLVACTTKTEENQIASINKRIAPDDYVTKTHLYIHWPAVYTKPRRNNPGGKELIKALTIKIPIEYLARNALSLDKVFKTDSPALLKKDSITKDYTAIINDALLIQDHLITSIHLRLMPGAKPRLLSLPNKQDTSEEAQRKADDIHSSYAVHIHRDDYHAIPLSDRKPNATVKESFYEKPPSFGCIVTSCFANFSLKGRDVQIGGIGESLEHPLKAQTPPEKPVNTFPQMPLNPVSAGLPKWREKVDPAQALLNSFILPEDSTEIKGMFTGK
jgi:hypothetical protein